MAINRATHTLTLTNSTTKPNNNPSLSGSTAPSLSSSSLSSSSSPPPPSPPKTPKPGSLPLPSPFCHHYSNDHTIKVQTHHQGFLHLLHKKDDSRFQNSDVEEKKPLPLFMPQLFGSRFPNFRILGVSFIEELMDIDSEHLGIQEAYHVMPLLRCHPLSLLRFARISVVLVTLWLEGVKFSTKGDIGTTNIVCKQNNFVGKPEEAIVIEMNEPLSNTITISLSNEPPFVVEYKIAKMGYVRFYLALRIKEDEKDTKPQV
ncbi:Proliferating cell nuclear antigen [Glycine soja]